ncbi:MAG TPA: hypothetical protein VFD42_08035 [Chloroflexota bacterium]|nr:hypothetical protein [Chloroflexota bacterium]
MLSTREGVEVIVPDLSTWTAEDLLVAGAWDDDLAELTDMDEEGVVMGEEDPEDGSPY